MWASHHKLVVHRPRALQPSEHHHRSPAYAPSMSRSSTSHPLLEHHHPILSVSALCTHRSARTVLDWASTSCPHALSDLEIIASSYPTRLNWRSLSGTMLTFLELVAMATYFELITIPDYAELMVMLRRENERNSYPLTTIPTWPSPIIDFFVGVALVTPS